MDFKAVLRELSGEFKKKKIRYALIGGFAAGLRGVGRSTVDLDFLVNKEDMPKVDAIMKALGYELRFGSENVSQYISPLRVFGEVDFIHAFRGASVEMLDRAEGKKVFDREIKVLAAEDLIGLKLQALKNDPSRKETEIKDIIELVSVWGDKLDWRMIRKYAATLGLEDLYDKIKAKKKGDK